MIFQLFSFLAVAGVILQVALLFLLLANGFTRYVLLFVYSIAQLLTGVLEFAAFHRFGDRAVPYVKLYWTDEVLLDLLLFLMVIGLTNRALEGSPLRAQIRKLLAVAGVVAVGAPFAIYAHRTLFSTPWFNGISQWLNFGAAIMNLGLWTALLANKKRDAQLVIVSLGLGVAVTGAAMGFGLRQFFNRTSSGARDFANLVGPLSHLLGLTMWCWAFRLAAKSRDAKPAGSVVTSSGY